MATLGCCIGVSADRSVCFRYFSKNVGLKKLAIVLFVASTVGLSVRPVEGAEVHGFRVETAQFDQMRGDRVFIYANHDARIRIFGQGLSSATKITFATKPLERGQSCEDLRATEVYDAANIDGADTCVIVVNLGRLQDEASSYFFCVRDNSTGATNFVHQGGEAWLQIGVDDKPGHFMPVWTMIIVLTLLLCLSGTFSGLNLGLMSLDKTELEIMIKSGTPKEKEYAKVIKPIRKNGNFLLCSILIGNVLINNTMAILLDDLTGSGLIAIVGSTVSIFIVGEIIPQAICARYALAVGARTIWLTKVCMFITFPVSYPISRILDLVLGDEIVHVYNRDRLRELIFLTEKQTDLKKEEVNIITGALELSQKKVSDIMTKLEDVFMIELNSILDFHTMNDIIKNGYSRIPVYEKSPKNIVGMLNMKDLAFVDPDDRMPLKTVIKFYNHPVVFVLEDTALDVMLQDFKKGHSHLAVVHRINKERPTESYYEPLGLITLEDIIEEIIQAEIYDETDIITDNRRRLPRNAFQKDFSAFNVQEADSRPRMPPQLALAAFQFLYTSVAPFHPDFISETVLQKVLKQDVIVNIQLGSTDQYIYNAGKPTDTFTMILQGRVEVQYAKDGIQFEGGPFSHFGIQALQELQRGSSAFQVDSVTSGNYGLRRQSMVPFIPDYSVRIISDVQCVCITRSQYVAAVNATSLERRRPTNPMDSISDDTFRLSWERYQQGRTEAPGARSSPSGGELSSSVKLAAPEMTKLLQNNSVETNALQNNKAESMLLPNNKAEADNANVEPIVSAHYSSMRLLSGIQDSGKP